ncbi:unnamed protein product [Clavelina lepadiformis]|uniref:G-protein coupled receptors family 2 profile 2 domain-containing protein n=1 Tax=Clavelina lepadiformis TaxID=159417 RepID=A0ABP0FSR1_CLALP
MLGMHYIVFLAINNETVASDSATLRVKVAFEMTFTSFQGCLISILYCFLNGEVQGEIIKVWSTWRSRNGVPAAGSRNCSSFYSNGIQMTSIASSHPAASNHDHSMRESAASSRRSTACDQSSSSNFNKIDLTKLTVLSSCHQRPAWKKLRKLRITKKYK